MSTSPFVPATWSFYELFQGFVHAPSYHLIFEVLLIVWIIRLVFFAKSYNPLEHIALTAQEKEELVAEWTPDPLVPYTPPECPGLQALENVVVSGKVGKYVVVNGKRCLNMASLNFLNLIGSPEIEEVAVKSVMKYGVGSCGPRGFYGTVDVHLKLEEQIAKFMNVEEAALYAYNFATIASAIPSYSKRGDIIFCDEGVCFAIQKGLQASRSQLKYFKHNDMDDLEDLLVKQQEIDKKDVKKAKTIRRFLVVEGLYMNYGDICPLSKLVELKYKYKVRLFIDETMSFGVLGDHGRGVTEHFNIPVSDIDLITASLENSIGSVGGVCLGTKYVVDHQRLSGLGYCFSASLPPMLAAAASAALKIMENEPNRLKRLRTMCEKVHNEFSKLQGLKISQQMLSAIFHLRLAAPSGDRIHDQSLLQTIVDKARDDGIALTIARYLEKDEIFLPPPSIRIAVNCDITDAEIKQASSVLQKLCEATL
ncbi:serine palmitoyltransferase 1-like [Tubulanus polymorphus]|uniref:serine palmitoyltransferase 1-like n=1 Tax=Tubulanus polymorphus TaxID=672921 RepID=UPI003DA58444